MQQNQSTQIEDAAIKAIYGLQYNTNRAARFVISEVPNTTIEVAIQTVNRVVRPTKRSKK